jgi:hypothetical protein
MLVVEWVQPKDFKDRDSFFDAYCEALAEVKVAKKFIAQFDPSNIEAQIKNLRQQLAKEGYIE